MCSVNLVRANGGVEAISVEDADELRALVGGYLEMVRTRDGRIMVLDEEGKLKGKPLNQEATRLYGANFDYIVGDVVVMDRIEAYRLLNDGEEF